MKEEHEEMKPIHNDLFELASRQMMLREQELEIEKQHIAVANKFGDKDIERDIVKHQESEKTKRDQEKTKRQSNVQKAVIAVLLIFGCLFVIALFVLKDEYTIAGDVFKVFLGAVVGLLGGYGLGKSNLLG